MNLMNTPIFKACEWVMRLSIVNLLWISFSIIGLFIFGFFPATVAMFTVVRKWVNGQTDIPIFTTFFHTFKSEWFKSNLLGSILTGIGLVIAIEFIVIRVFEHPILQLSFYPLVLLAVLYFMLLLYAFPTYVHFESRTLRIIKNSFLFFLINPLQNFIMILSLALAFSIFSYLPQLLIFFGGSVTSLICMWSCQQSFRNVEIMQKKLKVFQ